MRFDANIASGSIARTLQESRMIDRILTENTANHGTESYVVSVAPARRPRGGCKLLNNAPFEYGGTFKVPGRPFLEGRVFAIVFDRLRWQHFYNVASATSAAVGPQEYRCVRTPRLTSPG